jgi:septum formation protein
VKPLIFATTSSYKRQLLNGLGLSCSFADPSYAEGPLPHRRSEDWAACHAAAKAEALLAREPDALVVGLDQTLVLDGKVFGKPGSVAAAVQQLLELSGRTHALHTAVAMAESGQPLWSHTCVSHLTLLADLSPSFLEEMVRRDESWDCVGAYKIEAGASLILASVETEDPNAIIGVPMLALVAELDRRGYLPGRRSKAS